MVRIEIADGPSEMSLMFSLFRQAVGVGFVHFTPAKGQHLWEYPSPSIVQITLLERLQIGLGPCNHWRFEGEVVDQSASGWVFGVVGYVKGEFNTKIRKGWFDFEENPAHKRLIQTG